MQSTTIGVIGQGYVGKNYADALERRGHLVVRYALEAPYCQNKEKIAACDVTLIGVPTPTTPRGFDASIVESAIRLTSPGTTVVIKSTVTPGTTRRLQEVFPDRVVAFSPEFLREVSAAEDVEHPFASIVGIARDDATARTRAENVLALLPEAPFARITTSEEAELIKYAHNVNGYFQIILSNLLYDAAQAVGADWEPIAEAVRADPYVSNRYIDPVHKSGRGAGGHCFIKDFAAFRDTYERLTSDTLGAEALRALERKNLELLRSTGKDLNLLQGVYGPDLEV